MQNEPNLVRRRRIANSVLTKDYEEKCGKDLWENEPNSKPNKANLKNRSLPAVGGTDDRSLSAISVAGKPLYESICKYRVTVDLVKAVSFV